jgi:hypothetical protein
VQSQVLRLSVRAEWGFSVGSGSGAVRPTGVESTLRWLSGGATVPEVDPEREFLGVESTECADRRTGPTPRGLKRVGIGLNARCEMHAIQRGFAVGRLLRLVL